MNGDNNESFRSVSNDNQGVKNEQVNDRRYEEPRPIQGSEILQMVSPGATGFVGEIADETKKPPKNTDQLEKRLRNTDKSNWREIIYSYDLQKFEKEQIRLGLRKDLYVGRKVHNLSTATANKNVALKTEKFLENSENKNHGRILRSVNRGGRYTTSMIARNTGLSVSLVAPQLNILYNHGLVDRVSENQLPFIGSLQGKKTIRHVYFKKETDE
jgi:DNA-binding transcriptional ArsR family regulator